MRTRLLVGYGGMLLLWVAATVALFYDSRGMAALLVAAEQVYAALFLLVIARLIIGPLKDITKSTQELQAAESSAPVPQAGAVTGRKDEVGELARSIQAMASADRSKLSAEQQQRIRAQETARCVINSLPHAVALISPQGRVEIVNALAAKFGLAAGQDVNASGLKWLPLLLKEVIATGSPAGSGIRGIEEAHRESFVQKFEDGRELFFLPMLSPLVDDRGEFKGATLVLLDVTQERQVSEAKQGLLSTVSHQLKTPMTCIQMSIHLLLEDAADRLTPRQLELLQAARDDADRLYRLIEEMLAAARSAG